MTYVIAPPNERFGVPQPTREAIDRALAGIPRLFSPFTANLADGVMTTFQGLYSPELPEPRPLYRLYIDNDIEMGFYDKEGNLLFLT